MKEWIKDYIRLIGLVIGCAIVAILLLTLAYMIPRDLFVKHIEESESLLYALCDDHNINANLDGYVYDTKTNIITLEEVIAPREHTAFQDALLAPSSNYTRDFFGDWVNTLQNDAHAKSYSEDNKLTYPRYWHGFVLFLKPMFIFFNLGEIYQINTLIICALCFVTLLLIYKKEKAYVGPFLILLALFNPPYIARSFQLSSVFYAMIITSLLVLRWDDREKREHLFLYAFVIDGIILAFLDFLTYPPVAFVVPLCFVLVFSQQALLHNLLASIRYGIAFLLGYAGMWVSKWILASLFTDENVVAEGIESVLHRTGQGDATGADSAFNVEISPVSAMRENLRAFGTRPVKIMALLLLCAAVVLVVYMIRYKVGFTKRALGMFVIFVLLTIVPIAWIVVLYNHCSLHPHLEWREWLVAVFAPLMWLAWFWVDRRKKAVECR